MKFHCLSFYFCQLNLENCGGTYPHVTPLHTKPDRVSCRTAKFPRANFWSPISNRQPPTSTMVADKNQEMDYAIKPEAVNPTISSEDWPLLLKNYEKCTFCKDREVERG